MDFEAANDYLLELPWSEETYPFGPEVKVFKIKGKMFATLATDNGEARMNLKCDPHEALLLRELFSAVIPGYHMNKKHWNTICLDGSIPEGEIERMMDNSYLLVISKITKKDQASILVHL